MATECQICAEPFNRSTRAPISCESSDCNFQACKTCVRTYLLGTSKDPHCMSCRNAWSQNYLVMKLNRSFVTNDFKKHRKNLQRFQQIRKQFFGTDLQEYLNYQILPLERSLSEMLLQKQQKMELSRLQEEEILQQQQSSSDLQRE